MPTGYTAFIENKQCNSAKQFLKLCLRNFGVLCKYRDEPLSLDFEPDFTDVITIPVYDNREKKNKRIKNPTRAEKKRQTQKLIEEYEEEEFER